MAKSWLQIGFFLALSCTFVVAQSSEQVTQDVEPTLLDSLNQSSLQSAFQLLRQHYLEKEELSLDLLNRIALEGLLAHLGTGAELIPDSGAHGRSAAATDFRLVSELLTSQIVYVRPGSLGGSELKGFDSVLSGFQRSPALALILDLRSPGGARNFRNAAEFASRFLGAGTELFRIERSGRDEMSQEYKARSGILWDREIVVLVDHDTSPAGEVLAACLRSQLGSLVVGETTAGRTAEYEEVPIGKGGLLRYAVAEVVVDEDARLFGSGVVPDLESVLDPSLKLQIFSRAQETGVRPFVFEAERPRLNEAAIVAGINPALSDRLGGSDNNLASLKNPMFDCVLQSAIDVIASSLRIDGE